MVMQRWGRQEPYAGRWIDHIKLWEQQGKVGLPPGLQDVPPAPHGSRDYIARRTGYLLRPEVGNLICYGFIDLN
jgi:hypothetical protein